MLIVLPILCHFCVKSFFKKLAFHKFLSLHFFAPTPPIVHDLRILEPEPIQNIFGRNMLRLECTVSGNPLPTLEWSFDGEKFQPGKPFRSTDENAPVNHEISGKDKLAIVFLAMRN